MVQISVPPQIMKNSILSDQIDKFYLRKRSSPFPPPHPTPSTSLFFHTSSNAVNPTFCITYKNPQTSSYFRGISQLNNFCVCLRLFEMI